MIEKHLLRVQRISRSKFPSLYQVVADHCGQPLVMEHATYMPRQQFLTAHDVLIFPTGVSCPALATRGRLWPAVEAAETRSGQSRNAVESAYPHGADRASRDRHGSRVRPTSGRLPRFDRASGGTACRADSTGNHASPLYNPGGGTGWLWAQGPVQFERGATA